MASEQAEGSDAWDEYLTGPVPPEGGMNWDAYSHDELYQMLWRDADVADVSTVAAEWAQHRTALTTHAEVLREQAVALQDSWHGPAAEEAANRLDALAVRMEKISELAGAGQQAAQEAADALATARAMMPPPPSASPVAPFAEMPAMSMPAVPPVPAMPAMPAMPSLPNYAEMFAPPPAPTAPNMNTAFGAVGSGGFSFYFGAVGADQQKAQAVHAMQTYESRLMGGSRMIDEARNAIPPAVSPARAAGPAAGPATGGVPWDRLVAPGPGGGVSVGVGMSPVIGGAPGAGSPLGPGGRIGVLPGLPAAHLPAAHLAAESAAARAAGHGGMVPPVAGQRGDSDGERHENHLPKLGHRLFDVDMEASGSVIGLQTDEIGAPQ